MYKSIFDCSKKYDKKLLIKDYKNSEKYKKTLSKIKGFKDLNLFDYFIQTALDKFNFTSEIPKLDESAEKFHDYILNEESQIQDLIIYNILFKNKNTKEK